MPQIRAISVEPSTLVDFEGREMKYVLICSWLLFGSCALAQVSVVVDNRHKVMAHLDNDELTAIREAVREVCK